MKEITNELMDLLTEYVIQNIKLFGDSWQNKSKEEIKDLLTSLDVNFVENTEDLRTLKNFDPIAFFCKECGEVYFSPTSFRKTKIDNKYSKFLCYKCLKKNTYIEKYGVDNPLKNREILSKVRQTWDNKSEEELNDIYNRSGETRKNKSQEEKLEIQNKIKQTKLDRYGDENYNNQELHIKTMLNRYGVEYPIQNKQIFEKITNTKKEKYNDPYFNNLEKRHKTCQERYGTNNACEAPEVIEKINQATYASLGVKRPLQNPTFLKKMQNTMSLRYGGKTSFESEILQNKIKNTNVEKYGVDNPMKLPETKEKARQTLLEKTGIDHPIASKINYYGIFFDSKWEFSIWIYARDHFEFIIREPCYFEYIFEDSVHRVYPDFYYKGQLIEIKEDHLYNEKIEFSDKTDYEKNKIKYEVEKNNGVVFWFKEECSLFINYVNNVYGKNYMDMYYIDNPLNPSYFGLTGYQQIQKPYYSIPIYYTQPIISNKGISPFDINKEDEYTICKDSKGIYPIGFKKID